MIFHPDHTDEIELLQQKLEFAEFEWNRAIEVMQERDNRIEVLEAALRIFADDENWRYGRRFDPNGSRFDGIEFARAALDKDVEK
jgi:hypothetical protein